MTQDTGPALSIVVACCAQSACTGSRQHMQPTGAWKIPITGESQPNRHFISAKSDCEAFIHNVIQCTVASRNRVRHLSASSGW